MCNQPGKTVLSGTKAGSYDRLETNDRFRNRFRKHRDVKTGRYTALEIDARDAKENPNSEEEEPDLTAAFGREMDELALVVKELENKVDVQDVEEREFSESMYEGVHV